MTGVDWIIVGLVLLLALFGWAQGFISGVLALAGLALGAWIGTTCRHEALAVIRRAKRSQPVGDPDLLDRTAGPAGEPDAPILIADRNADLWTAFGRLSRRCQDVLRVLVVDVPEGRPSYELAAAALGVPIGSLGPTRGRCLTQLRGFLTEGIADANAASWQ